jgi:Cap4 SAVED domain
MSENTYADELTVEDLKKMLTHTESFMNHVYHIRQDFCLVPQKEHYLTTVNYVDLIEYREEFLEELINTICDWVYSQSQAKQIIDELVEGERRSLSNANSVLTRLSLKYFRDRDDRVLNLQGQFGELLLFNFLQHFFNAVPLLRKMQITTSTGHERFGADAVHYKKTAEDKNILYLGESKIYTSDYRFKSALETSIESILTTYKNLNKELNLYTYSDFLEDKLVKVARSYKRATLPNTEIQLVCLVGYNESSQLNEESEETIKAHIKQIVEEKCRKLDGKVFSLLKGGILNRINYILFPVWKLDELVEDFQNQIR